MARRTGTRTLARGGRTSVVVVPAGGGTGRRIARVAGRAAARYGAQLAREEKHTLVALGAAAFMGLATRMGWNLPKLPGSTPALSAGLVAWGIGKFSKNEIARHAGTGLLSVGVYDLIAYTGRTREEIETLVERQREEEDREESSGLRGFASGTMGG